MRPPALSPDHILTTSSSDPKMPLPLYHRVRESRHISRAQLLDEPPFFSYCVVYYYSRPLRDAPLVRSPTTPVCSVASPVRSAAAPACSAIILLRSAAALRTGREGVFFF